MNVFDTKHSHSVQESLHLIATPPLSLGKVSWIFKDQDYQHSSLSEKVFLFPPLLPRPSPPPTSSGLFFSHISQKYNNNQSSCGSDPSPPSFKRATYSLNTTYLLKSVGSCIFTLYFMFFGKSSHLGDKIHTGFKQSFWGAKCTGHPHNMSVY